GVVSKGGFLHIYRNKILFSYAAHRADFQGRIKDFSAYQAFNKCTGALRLLGIFFFLEDAAEIVAVFVGIDQVYLSGFKADLQAVYHFHAQLAQSLQDMGHALSAPAVASESAGQLAAMGSCENRGGQIPDRL